MVELDAQPVPADETVECALCLDRMPTWSGTGAIKLEEESDEGCVMRTVCGHHFHRECLRDWIGRCGSERASCPLCREAIR